MPTGQIYKFGHFELLPAERLLLRGDQIVELPPKVFDTLVILVRNRGHVVEKDEIMRSVWPDSFVEEGNLTRNIFVLRRALNQEDSSNQYIETVPKVGYRFAVEVNELGAESADTAIERLTVSRTSTIEEERIGLKALSLPAGLRRLGRSRVGATAGIATLLLAVLAIAWFWLPRAVPEAEGVRRAPLPAAFAQISDQPGVELFPSLSPNGKLLVYASNRSGNWDIYLQRIGGQTAINLTPDSPAEDTHPAFSPDGERIIFRSSRGNGGIFIMGATGENVRRVADFGFNPEWSPDGRDIVCAMDEVADPSNRSIIPSQLWALNVDTGAKRLIFDGDSVQPQWSPNGHRIAYWGLQKGGQRDIWTVSSDGSAPVAITDDEFFDWNPVWSPDGTYLYFISDRGGSMNLWRAPIEEHSGKIMGPAEPVTIPAAYAQHIEFSLNGRQLAYVRMANRLNIKRVAFDSAVERLAGEPTWITQGDKQTASPDLSPDGEMLAFRSQKEKQEDIFVAKSDGTALRQLTDDIYRDRGPRWSPDGNRIAFYSDRSGKYEIWIVNSDGTGLRQLTSTSYSLVFYPVWSPDSTRLAYRTRGNPASIVDVEKTWDQQSPETLPMIDSDNRLRFTPWSWSSDGRKLAGWQYAPKDPHSGIVLYSLDSKQFEKLTDFGNRPVWLRDDRRLLFFYRDKLYLLDSRSGKVKQLLSTAPDTIEGLTISRDNGSLCFSIEIVEADIWLATFD